MKIIHTSDWHLGARLHDVSREEEHRNFLEWLVTLVEAEHPDALVISGDIFDTRQPSAAAQKLYCDFLARVGGGGLCQRVVVIAGNHDSQALLESAKEPLACIRVVVSASFDANNPALLAVPVKNADGSVGLVIGAIPFMNNAELANLGNEGNPEEEREVRVRRGFERSYALALQSAKAVAATAPVVLTGHCYLAGSRLSDSKSERAMANVGGLGGFDAAAMGTADYVALGHLHQPQCVGGKETIAYSGAPLAMSFAEAGQRKYVNVVTFGTRAGDPVTVEKREIPQWALLKQLRGTADELRDAVSAERGEENRKTYLSVQVTELDGDFSALVNEFRTILAGRNVLLLFPEDVRPRQTAGLNGLVEQGVELESMTELEMARMRLQDAGIANQELDRLLLLVNDVIEYVNN